MTVVHETESSEKKFLRSVKTEALDWCEGESNWYEIMKQVISKALFCNADSRFSNNTRWNMLFYFWHLEISWHPMQNCFQRLFGFYEGWEMYSNIVLSNKYITMLTTIFRNCNIIQICYVWIINTLAKSFFFIDNFDSIQPSRCSLRMSTTVMFILLCFARTTDPCWWTVCWEAEKGHMRLMTPMSMIFCAAWNL